MKLRKFDQLYQQIMESITTSSAGIGAVADSTMSGDTYAPGDARVPHVLGMGGKKGKRRKIPMIKRNFPTGL